MKFPCGCINETDPASGVTKAVSKCEWHKARMGRGGLSYYEELGCLKDGKAIPTNHIKEFKEALELMGAEPLNGEGGEGICLEIGCGVGTYIDWVCDEAGYEYEGVEPDRQAAEFTWLEYDRCVYPCTFEDWCLVKRKNQRFDLILAAHVIEHFKDSPAAIQLIYNRLKPGGRALLLIPDDTDQTNPDHLWFYTPKTFLAVLQQAGFVDIRMCVRRITSKENFIYVSAWRPND